MTDKVLKAHIRCQTRLAPGTGQGRDAWDRDCQSHQMPHCEFRCAKQFASDCNFLHYSLYYDPDVIKFNVHLIRTFGY